MAAPAGDTNNTVQWLVKLGYISEQQLKSARRINQKHPEQQLEDILIQLEFITDAQLLEAQAKALRVKLIHITKNAVNLEAVRKVPRQFAEKYCVIPVGMAGDVLTLAMADPTDLFACEDVRQTADMNVEPVLAPESEIRDAIYFCYAEIESLRSVRSIDRETAAPETADAALDESTPVTTFLDNLIQRALAMGASDIHIEPFDEKMLIRMRIDGTIVNYVSLSNSMHQSIIARIKILAELDIAEKRIPQDGHFRSFVQDPPINIRVSVIPTVFGEKAVLRLLFGSSTIDYAEHFGMRDADYAKFSRMLKMPNGIIYITGPTGSGKSTTLYMVLESMSWNQVNISTIEDPVEKNLPRVNQMQVNNQAGLTFESGLRALLRQDPDVIMVGETRDTETAAIAVRAAITGHLVLSTLHTNDAASTVARLEDMGVEPYIIASSLVGVVAQRLVRKLCPSCSAPTELTPEEESFLGKSVTGARRPVGCPRCNQTGYRGRTAVHEILVVDREVRRLVAQGASVAEIKAFAVEKQGMSTLKNGALQLIEAGVTSPAEVMKIAYSVD